MPTLDWLKKEFDYGYDSGNVLSIIPNLTRYKEEKLIGGSYRKVFRQAILPYLKSDSSVLELGPGKGSWSRAILAYIPQGELHTIDFQDVTKWLKPEQYQGRLVCHQIQSNNDYSCIKNDHFDLIWSMGVLCHNNAGDIKDILTSLKDKLKINGIAVHGYGDWDKLEKYGWEKGGIPLEFKQKTDDQIWWPRNNQLTMSSLAQDVGYKVITTDLGLVKRDSIIVLQKVR